MFVPVACTACGRAFQVPLEQRGQTVVCPWCTSATPALPISPSAAGAVAAPPATPPAVPASPPLEGVYPPPEQVSPPAIPASSAPAVADPLPVPLDVSAEPAAMAAPAATAATATSGDTAAPEIPPLSGMPVAASPSRITPLQVTIGMVAMFVLAVLTLAALRYQRGYGIAAEWREWTAPDGSVHAAMLGPPREQPFGNGLLWLSRGWYSGAEAWAGWQPLSDNHLAALSAQDARQRLDSLVRIEADRLEQRYGGTARTATLQFGDPLIVEIKLEYERGRAVSRVQIDGRHRRAYYFGLAGPRLDWDGLEVQHVWHTFQVVGDAGH